MHACFMYAKTFAYNMHLLILHFASRITSGEQAYHASFVRESFDTVVEDCDQEDPQVDEIKDST